MAEATVSAFLDENTTLTGTVVLGGPAKIEGRVEGEVTAKDVLTVGKAAVVNAKITGTTVTVHGTVKGDINASTRLELCAPCRVTGNISAPSLVIHEGATFEGNCTMASTSSSMSRVTPITAATAAAVG
jgi:cytoskeletal protein CcmA (bactofilin family)